MERELSPHSSSDLRAVRVKMIITRMEFKTTMRTGGIMIKMEVMEKIKMIHLSPSFADHHCVTQRSPRAVPPRCPRPPGQPWENLPMKSRCNWAELIDHLSQQLVWKHGIDVPHYVPVTSAWLYDERSLNISQFNFTTPAAPALYWLTERPPASVALRSNYKLTLGLK